MTRSYTVKPPLVRATKSAHILIESLFKTMQESLKIPGSLEDKNWERMFGDKQSIVSNLQKLVQALVLLPAEEEKQSNADGEDREGSRLSREEIAMLTAWLSQSAEGERC